MRLDTLTWWLVLLKVICQDHIANKCQKHKHNSSLILTASPDSVHPSCVAHNSGYFHSVPVKDWTGRRSLHRERRGSWCPRICQGDWDTEKETQLRTDSGSGWCLFKNERSAIHVRGLQLIQVRETGLAWSCLSEWNGWNSRLRKKKNQKKKTMRTFIFQILCATRCYNRTAQARR